MNDLQVHKTADVQSNDIGKGTKIWQSCIILPLAKIGKECNINAFCFVENDVVIGDRVTLKCGVYVWDGVRIEDNVFIGPNVTLANDRFPRSKQHVESINTTFKKGCSIGGGSVILPGITVGEYSMVGAGSVVTHDVPPYSICYGSPANVHGHICSCGNKLDDSAVCQNCGKKYEYIGMGLQEIHA